MFFVILFTVVLLVGANGSTQFRVTDLIGVWQNQLKSTFNITHVDAVTMELRGLYRSPSGTPGFAYPALGYFNSASTNDTETDSGLVVCFSVNWGSIGSVTTWNGIVRDNGILIGQWLLVRPVSSYVWDHILTGQDTFVKM